MARKATAQDVADLAGVSRSAVSLVLNGRAAGNISAAKQQAVIAAAQQLSYTPNAVAISLRSQRTRTLGVLTWPGPFSFGQVLLHRVLQKAHDYRYLLLAMDTNGDREEERRQLEILRDRQVDGFLVVAPDMTEYAPPEPLLTTPTVLLNCADPHGALTSVAPDEVEAGRRAAEVLIGYGHRRIGVLTGDPDTLQNRLRLFGVEHAFRLANLEVPQAVAAGGSIDGGYHAARSLLVGPERPTALICGHERLAVGAALAATGLGMSIPADLSLVSLEEGQELAANLVPPLTTVQRPDRAMGEQAVTLLVERLSGNAPPEVKQLLFSCVVHPRASVAAPAAPEP